MGSMRLSKKVGSIRPVLRAHSNISKLNLVLTSGVLVLVGCLALITSFAVTPNSIPGDINGDNTVNILDLSLLLTNYGKSAASAINPSADINKDGTVDISDLSILLSNYNKSGNDLNAPAAPTGLQVTTIDKQVLLNWSDNTEADFATYSIWRSTQSNPAVTSAWTQLDGNLNISLYNDTAPGLVNGVTYYYFVTATDSSGNVSGHSNVISAVPGSNPTPPPPASTYGSGSQVLADCGPVAIAADGTMVWYSRGADGLDDVYVGDSNCNGSALLPSYDGHRGPSDLTKDGRYVLLVTAVGWDRKTEGAAPGKGSQNAIQLYDRQTGRLSTLLAGAKPTQRGVIWPKFNADYTKIAWAQMVRSPFETGEMWGDWEVHVADVNLANGTLTNDRSWRDPSGDSGIMEAYGWLPNSNKVVFQSSVRSSLGFPAECQLWTLPDNFNSSTVPTRITPPFTDSITNKSQDVFQEFVHFKPGDSNKMYVSVGAQTVGGNDVFAYDLSSANQAGMLAMPKRISYLGGARNKYDLPMQADGWPAPSYKVVTSIAWYNGAWMAAVCPDIYCTKTDAWRFVESYP
jgi:hypothetical protein